VKSFEDFAKIPAFETVKRCRAYIQNVEGILLPTDPDVIKKRSQRQQTFRKQFFKGGGEL
jgi:hypothetical protein